VGISEVSALSLLRLEKLVFIVVLEVEPLSVVSRLVIVAIY
jgi:hypothetical protein